MSLKLNGLNSDFSNCLNGLDDFMIFIEMTLRQVLLLMH